MRSDLKICLYCARYQGEPFNLRPLGISYLASYLLGSDVVAPENVAIVDSVEEAIAFQPDILAVSSVSQVFSDARRFARRCKDACGCLTVIGGYHISSAPGNLPEEFDLGVIGEGERTFAEIVENHSGRSFDAKNFSDVEGLCFHDSGKVVETPLRAHLEDLDALPWPMRPNRYSSEEPVFTSRGCPYRCTFCASQGFWRNQTRFRSASSVVQEIADVVDSLQPSEIVILDDLWMADKSRFRKIVAQLSDLGIPEKVTFRGFCRSNIVDEETILLLKELNYRYVRFGAETGSDDLLTRIKGKGISVNDHQRVIDLCRKHDMKCGASFMFGIPGETYEDLKATVDFLRTNKGYFEVIGFYLFNPIPGTVLWDELSAKDQLDHDFNFEKLQLDLLRKDFSWDEILYFNEDRVPLQDFRRIVTEIRDEFIYKLPVTKELPKSPVSRIARFFKRFI